MPLPYDPASLESEPGYISELLHQFQIQIEQCIPCIVTKYNQEDCTVNVQPLPQRAINTDEGLTYKDRPVIPSVPILRFLHGGFSINSPIFVGDTGYLIASDRSCSLAQKENSATLFSDDNPKEKNKGSFPPDDLSLGQYTSGFFLPCSWSKEGNPNGELIIEGIGKQPNDNKWQKIRLSNDGTITIETKDRQIVIGKDGINLSSGEVKLSVSDDRIVTELGESSVVHTDKDVSINISGRTLAIDKSGVKYNGEVDSRLSFITKIRRVTDSEDIEVKTQSVDISGNIIIDIKPETQWIKV
jgi:hypothetical protein